ncbi:MAG: acetyltransferase, family [Bacteroidetes bacterium]|nr:acetyltransferase, family [Bacteroidota bacterium]
MVKVATTAEELQHILKLRYQVLRQPWDQPAETATDDLEHSSINAFITNEKGNVIACGRLQENENKKGQIRFMAVADDYQGKGLGKMIVKFLESKGRELGLTEIELQARENAVKFYEECGYSIKEKSFLLWGQIRHFLMVKEIH